MNIAKLVLLLMLFLNPSWVIVKNGLYLIDAGGSTTSVLSEAKQFTSQSDAQDYMTNARRHNPMAAWSIQEIQ